MNFINSKILQHLLLDDFDEKSNGELIEMIPSDDNSNIDSDNIPEEVPILPVKNTVLFPGIVIPITVGRPKSIRLVKKAYRGNRIIGVVAQQNIKAENPTQEDLYKVGTVAHIIKMLVLPDGNTTIIIQGHSRFKIKEFIQTDPFMVAKLQLLKDRFPSKDSPKTQVMVQSLKEIALKILQLNPEIPDEAQNALENIESPAFLTHFLSSNINAEVADKQRLLEISDGTKRVNLLFEYMRKELQVLELKQEIHDKVHSDIDEQQRDYFLRQQMKVLQDELGYDSTDKEIEELRIKGAKKKWPKAIAKHFNKELDKITRMNPAAAEYPVAMNYVELLIDLPWGKVTDDNYDLTKARKILDNDHFGLEKVKDRIIEYLAVLKLKKNMKGPILCLYGPPGVGKTSLGKSIAKALNRKYVRMSLGGVHDESEIRGHRRTYVGAMPGKIIQNIRKSKSDNPVFILDEIDKVDSNFRGDPSSALLEVLDPEQNNTFMDNFLEVEYDLSKVLFIATANEISSIQPALRDRMELIQISGYTLEEKVQIAKKHLIPKQRTEHGLKAEHVTFNTNAIEKIIQEYTKESGVRSLERQIAKIIRHAAKSIALEQEYTKTISPAQVEKILGAPYFDQEIYENNELAGVVTGLAWTQYGGEILFIECSLSRGKGKLTLSGQLGDVMKESAMAALSYLKNQSQYLGISYKVFEQYDLHIHVPAGAVPKDGPSAGITMFTALASIYTQRKVKAKLAMTGEITLSGKVLPVGGIKEKILAAKRAGIKEIIMSAKNEKDILEIGEKYLKGLKIHYVETGNQVLELALLKQKVKNPITFIIEENNNK